MNSIHIYADFFCVPTFIMLGYILTYIVPHWLLVCVSVSLSSTVLYVIQYTVLFSTILR